MKKGRRKRQLVIRFSYAVTISVVCMGLAVCIIWRFRDAGGGIEEAAAENEKYVIDTEYTTGTEHMVDKGYMIDIDGLSQKNIPTGCEAVSTVTVLRHYGIDIMPKCFIEKYLPKQDFYKKGGKVYGADPEKAFAGNPYERGSLGCYEGVIVRACKNMIGDRYEGAEDINVQAIRGITLEELTERYVSAGTPVIIWVTSYMHESEDGFSYYLESGEKYVWRANEHCVVLCGFDRDKYYITDPLQEGKTVAYDKELVDNRYEEMGMRAVVITEKKN